MSMSITATNPPQPAEFLTHDRQKQAMLMLALTFISYCIDAGLLLVFALNGAVRLGAALIDFLGALLICGSFLLIFRFGWNQYFNDRNLTMVHAFLASTLYIGLSIYAPEMGVLSISILFIIFTFATLSLPWNSILHLWIGTTFFIVLTGTLEPRSLSFPHASHAQAMVSSFWLATVLGRCAFIGHYGAHVRKRLGERNRQLTASQTQLKDIASHDALTGAFNRGAILAQLTSSMASSMASSIAPAFQGSVIMIDLDHFKQINDQFGHLTGDLVLQQFVRLIQGMLRDSDALGRYGGEEFLLLLPNVDNVTSARMVTERLRQTIINAPWSDIDENLHVTASMGIACRRRGDTTEDLLHRADAALYRAKANGRNRVEQ